jgi:hypothetical protein
MTAPTRHEKEIGKPAIMDIIRELGYRKVCTKCVPKVLTAENKTVQ